MNSGRAAVVLCSILSLLLISLSAADSIGFASPVAAAGTTPNISYMNLRFVSYKFPPGTVSTVNAQDGVSGPNVYTGATTLRNIGINGIRANGMSWTQYDLLGISGWQNAIDYEARAFDQQGISIVWGLPILDDIRHYPPDLLFYATNSVPDYIFGGSGSNSVSTSAAQSLFDSNAVYWGKTTNTQFTAANGTVILAGKFSWPWADQYSGLPVWKAYGMMLDNTIPTLITHPSTFALKLMNEPFNNGWSASQLANYDSYLGRQIRTEGWTGYIDYGASTVTPGVSDIEFVAPKSTTGSYLFPLMFEFHYPSSVDLDSVRSAVSQMGGTSNIEGWDGEDWITYLNGQNGAQPDAVQQASFGVTADAFGLDINCDGVDLSATCQALTYGKDGNIPQLISVLNSAYGNPIFFSASNSTSTTVTSKVSSTSSGLASTSFSISSSPTSTLLGSTSVTSTTTTGTETSFMTSATSSVGTPPLDLGPILGLIIGSIVIATVVVGAVYARSRKNRLPATSKNQSVRVKVLNSIDLR